MKAFWSGTDENNLREFTKHHAYYLSLIVNFSGEYVARLCVMGKRKSSGTVSLSVKGIKQLFENIISNNVEKEEDVIYVIDLNIVKPIGISKSPFQIQLENLTERKKKKVDTYTYNRDYHGFNNEYDEQYSAGQQTSMFSQYSATKSIVEFSDIEVEDFLKEFLFSKKSNAKTVKEIINFVTENYSKLTVLKKQDYIDHLNENYLDLYESKFKDRPENVEQFSLLLKDKVLSFADSSKDDNEFKIDLLIVFDNYIEVSLINY